MSSFLQTLGSGDVSLPEEVAAAANSLQTAIAIGRPLDEVADAHCGSGPVEEVESHPSDGGSPPGERADPADVVMQEIVLGPDDASDAQLASLAKRLKAAHRSVGSWSHHA